MLGLEYALHLCHMSQTELADALGIKKQNIHSWLSGKQAISKKHLPTMEKLFDIPQEYLTKDLNRMDMLRIQQIKLYGQAQESKPYQYGEDIQTLIIVLKNYVHGLITTDNIRFHFQSAYEHNGVIYFEKVSSFEEFHINIAEICSINYSPEPFQEHCTIRITLSNNSSIIIMLYDKQMELFLDLNQTSVNDQCDCIEADLFLYSLQKSKFVKIEYAQSSDMELHHIFNSWNIKEDSDSYTESPVEITFYNQLPEDANTTIDKKLQKNARMTLRIATEDEMFQIYPIYDGDSSGLFKIQLPEAPYIKFLIYTYYDTSEILLN